MVGKELDEAFRKINELMESWNNRLTISNLALAKRYIKGELEILLHLKCSPLRGRPENCQVVLKGEHSPKIERDGWQGRKLLSSVVESSSSCLQDRFLNRPYRNDESVFVYDGELMDSPKGAVPSLVWFELPDKCDSVVAGSLYFSKNFGFKTIAAVTDWKSCLRAQSAAIVDDERPSKKIKASTKVMNCIADNRAPSERDIFSYSDASEYLSRLRILITNDTIWLFVEEGGDLGFEIADVLFGPFDLQLCASQQIRKHLYPNPVLP